jgi:hypothetical protein
MRVEKCYYFGEFGHLNLEILGGLEAFFKKNNRKKISIMTFDNYGKLLCHLFGKNVEIKPIQWSNQLFSGRRCGHEYFESMKLERFIKMRGYNKNLYRFLRSNLNNSRKNKMKMGSDYQDIAQIYISKPISMCGENKKFISIFPRMRSGGAEYKNISEENWYKILERVNKFNYPIVVHGAGKEFIKIKGKNIIYPKNVLDQVKYLNNSICSICPDSGFAHFSLNCGCDTLVIGKSYWPFIQFNPFNNRLEVISLRRATNTGFVGDFISGKSHKLYHLWFYYIYTPPRRVSTFVYWKLFKLFTKAFPGLKTQIKRFLKKN